MGRPEDERTCPCALVPFTVRRMNVYMQTVLSYEHARPADYDAVLAALNDESTPGPER